MGAQIRTGCYIHKNIQQHVVIKTASKLLDMLLHSPNPVYLGNLQALDETI